MSGSVSVRLALLDNQLVDADGLPIGRVDDLELSAPADGGAVRLEAILTGAQALGERIGGAGGKWLGAVAARLRPRSTPGGAPRIDAELIDEIEPLVRLTVQFRDLPNVAGLERWLARHVVERLPGAGDAN